MGEAVGYGSFSTVYKATHKPTGQIVAVKVAKIEEETGPEAALEDQILAYGRERIEREIELWKPLDHVNLCKLLKVIFVDGKVAFVMEYAENGDLLTRISETPLDLSTVRDYFGQLCAAVHFLHSRNIIHGDIKLENILLTEGGVKLSDFGLARYAAKERGLKNNCGTVEYAAPELLTESEDDCCPFKADIWALGVALYALLYRTFPFDGPTVKILKVRILTLEPVYPEIEDNRLLSILKGLLQKDPKGRPSIGELCEMLAVQLE